MLFEWLKVEGGAIFGWWLLSVLVGIAAFPLFFRLLNALPSRGYALAKAGGILLIGFIFWLLNILGLLQNTPGGIVFVALVVFFAGLASHAVWAEREPILPFLRRNWSHILFAELLFLVMFLGWAYIRAHNPEIYTTEKPMDLAFLSASRRSATFPPHDPWMSGYAISYYHFGYILMSMFANMTGVSNGMALNLSICLLFALTGVTAFGVVYDLIAAQVRYRLFREKLRIDENQALQITYPNHYPGAITMGILAAVFAVVMGNLGTAIVEIPYQTCTASAGYLRFMDIEERNAYPNDDPTNCATSKSLDSANWNVWWWFRYSRVVLDKNLDGSPLGAPPITEFPQFSFILADMHPHVLALPFAALVIGLALSLAMRRTPLRPWEVVLYAIFTGAMVFLNSWDAAYLGVVIGAEGLRRLITNRTGRFVLSDWFGIIRFGIAMVVLTGLLYAPFFISFRSQAEGFAPNVIWPTRFQQFYLMFGTFVTIIIIFLVVEMRRARDTFNARFGLQAVGAIAFIAVVAFLLLSVVAWTNPTLRQPVFQMVDESGGFWSVFPTLIARRAEGLVTELVLLFMLFVVLGRLFARLPAHPGQEPKKRDEVITYSPATGAALLFIAAGAALILIPEFGYLRDNFGVRMNTVFKLYYQAWILWSIGSAFALWSILFDWAESPAMARQYVSTPVRAVVGVLSLILIAMGLLYPIQAVRAHYISEGGWLTERDDHQLTLDGSQTMAVGNDDYNAITCLMQTAQSDSDVVAEGHKPSAAYAHEYGRVSALSGIPTILGWQNHESQWRGESYNDAAQGRPEAVDRLYNSTNWADVLDVIRKYGITYVYVGPTERQLYTEAGLAKFDGLTPVCKSGNVAVYSTDAMGLQVPAGR